MKVRSVKTAALASMAAPYNPRKISKPMLDALARSMSEFGVVEPIVVNKRTGRIVGGHQRVKAAEQSGVDTLPVVEVDLDETQEKQLNLALNKISGQWDDEALYRLLAELDSPEIDMAATGFDDRELRRLLRAGENEFGGVGDPEVVPEKPKNPKTQMGDLITLGRHKLLCGDSAKRESYDRVCGEAKIDLVLTDPPYGIDLGYDNYADTDEALVALASAFLPLCRERSSVVVLTPGVRNVWLYPAATWVLCWYYGGGQFRAPWGFNCWQPFLCYGKDPMLANGKGSHPDGIDLNAPANAADIDHPCPKPMRLWEWALDRCSLNGALVLDPFMGSGTTLIACETTKRTAFGIEISPTYCDVIVKRWQMLTGKKAEGWRGNE